MAELDAAYRVARYLCPDAGVAAALVEDVYTEVFAGRLAPKAGEADLRLWLFEQLCAASPAHGCQDPRQPTPIESLRSTGEHRAPDVGGTAPACYDLSALDWARVDERLGRMLERLPWPYRPIFLLWAGERLTCDQIASVMQVPAGIVTARLHRARMIVSTDLGALAEDWRLAAWAGPGGFANEASTSGRLIHAEPV